LLGSPLAEIKLPKPQDTKSIWEEEEVSASELDKFEEDPADDRTRPDYDILYKQAVKTEDVFLGMNPEANPSSASCSHMVVRVRLPGALMKDLSLDVIPTRFLVRSAK
jgi:hypothetical protein